MPKLIVFTGAGLSAPSGLGVFRGAGGLWEGHDIKRVCSQETWKANYEVVHAFYSARRQQYAVAEPSAGHRLVARWASEIPGTTVFTQNVDLLLEAAGCADTIHLHGRIDRMECTACGTEFDFGMRAWEVTDRCPRCRSHRGVKPGIVFGGGRSPAYAVMDRTFEALRAEDLAVVIGTSGQVIPHVRLLYDLVRDRFTGGFRPKRRRPFRSLLMVADAPEPSTAALFDEVVVGRIEAEHDRLDERVRTLLAPRAAPAAAS